MKKTLIITLAVVALLVLWVMSSYNGLVTAQTEYTAQWSQVENQYQRRFDLIPNILGAVKGSLKQELAVFGEIAEARTRYSGVVGNANATQGEKVAATAQVESALGRLLVITENYPELKSNNLIQDLLTQLEGTANRVAVERQKYNDSVKTYNLKVQRVPGSIAAALFGFPVEPYFEATKGSDVAPKVEL